MSEEPNWVQKYNGFNNGIDPSDGVGGNKLELSDLKIKTTEMSNNTDKPEFGDWIKSTSGQKCLMWPISDPKYLENRLFWAFEAGRDVFWKKYINQKSQISSLESQLKENDREIAALRSVNKDNKRIFESEKPSLREQIEKMNEVRNAQMSTIQHNWNKHFEEIESIRGENTELRQALKEAVYFMDNHKDQMAYNPVDKCRKLIVE